MLRHLLFLLLFAGSSAFAQVHGKPASPVVFDPAAFGANSTPAPDSYYHIDEGSGTSIENIGKDAGSFDGTISGAAWTTDTSLPVLEFEAGTNDMVTIAGVGGITGYPFTVAVWVDKYVTDNAGDLISVGDLSTNNTLYGLRAVVTDRAQIYAQNTTAFNVLAAPSGPSNLLNTWSLVVGVFESDTAKHIYVDNDASATLSDSVTFSANVDTLRVGHRVTSGADTSVDIRVAGVAIWKGTALSAAQVQTDLYNSGGWAPFVTTSAAASVILLDRRH